jgi:hypothetical protein
MSRVASGFCVSGIVFLIGCTDEPLRAQKMPGPTTVQNWAQQDQATNVQDWHRMAQKIADAMQARGLLAAPTDRSSGVTRSATVPQPFYVHSGQNTPFVRELGLALKTEILQRGGSLATYSSSAQIIELGVNVVAWGSRVRSDPERLRAEAIWFASINSQDRVVMTIQEPFYIFASDIPHYVQAGDSEQTLPRIARPLLYVRSRN